MSVRSDQHVIAFTVMGDKPARLTMKVQALVVQGVLYDLPDDYLGEADVAAVDAAFQELVQIAVTNGYNWPV